MAEKLYIDVDPLFSRYLNKWSVSPIGEPMFRHSSCLLPVKMTDERPAMLKIALEEREKSGGIMMQWWAGNGAAQVYACEDNALLMEYAQGRNSLVDMAMNGYDDEASLIGCQVIAKLHEPRVSEPPSQLLPLKGWFESLEHLAQKEGGIFIECSKTAQFLLADQQNIVILHGDVHHENILDFGSRGWLAIDPKGLLGERRYDYANLSIMQSKDART